MGPLSGIKVIEMKGIGPGPYAGMLLADMGADVLVIERASSTPGIALPSDKDVNSRGKKSIAIDVKNPSGLATLLRLVANADMFFEGYRPGVAERLGFGPETCLETNPRLVYGRLTGWGQHGPLAKAAGHDINFISITGALAAIGDREQPVPPLNLVGDYAGGSLFLVVGLLAGLLEARTSGKGQVIDAAITDGSASLMSIFHSLDNLGYWSRQRSSNMLDGAAYYYGVYETSDAKHVSVGPLEPAFYETLVQMAGLNWDEYGTQAPPEKWPECRQDFTQLFKSKTQQEWCDLLEGTDACFAPVLDFAEAPEHIHNQARGTYLEIDGIVQPSPAPRFSRTSCDTPSKPPAEGQDTDSVLLDAGFSSDEIIRLRSEGALT